MPTFDFPSDYDEYPVAKCIPRLVMNEFLDCEIPYAIYDLMQYPDIPWDQIHDDYLNERTLVCLFYANSDFDPLLLMQQAGERGFSDEQIFKAAMICGFTVIIDKLESNPDIDIKRWFIGNELDLLKFSLLANEEVTQIVIRYTEPMTMTGLLVRHGSQLVEYAINSAHDGQVQQLLALLESHQVLERVINTKEFVDSALFYSGLASKIELIALLLNRTSPDTFKLVRKHSLLTAMRACIAENNLQLLQQLFELSQFQPQQLIISDDSLISFTLIQTAIHSQSLEIIDYLLEKVDFSERKNLIESVIDSVAATDNIEIFNTFLIQLKLLTFGEPYSLDALFLSNDCEIFVRAVNNNSQRIIDEIIKKTPHLKPQLLQACLKDSYFKQLCRWEDNFPGLTYVAFTLLEQKELSSETLIELINLATLEVIDMIALALENNPEKLTEEVKESLIFNYFVRDNLDYSDIFTKFDEQIFNFNLVIDKFIGRTTFQQIPAWKLLYTLAISFNVTIDREKLMQLPITHEFDCYLREDLLPNFINCETQNQRLIYEDKINLLLSKINNRREVLDQQFVNKIEQPPEQPRVGAISLQDSCIRLAKSNQQYHSQAMKDLPPMIYSDPQQAIPKLTMFKKHQQEVEAASSTVTFANN